MGQIHTVTALSVGVMVCIAGGWATSSSATAGTVIQSGGPGQCHTVTVCAPRLPVKRVAPTNVLAKVPAKVTTPCPPRRHLMTGHPRRGHRTLIHPPQERVPAQTLPPPRVVVITAPCPPRATETLPADYPSAIQNGYIVWASRYP